MKKQPLLLLLCFMLMLSITHGYADQYTISGEGENGEKVEITVDTYAQDVAVLNGTLSFVYTAPIE